jgi:hypothetical protein
MKEQLTPEECKLLDWVRTLDPVKRIKTERLFQLVADGHETAIRLLDDFKRGKITRQEVLEALPPMMSDELIERERGEAYGPGDSARLHREMALVLRAALDQLLSDFDYDSCRQGGSAICCRILANAIGILEAEKARSGSMMQ